MVKKKYSLILLISVCVVFLDLVTKWLIHSSDFTLVVFPFLKIFPVTNTGAAFSILQNATLLLIFVSLIVIGGILYYLDKIETKYYLGVSLILGGAVGNLIDRIFLGHVRDFISVSTFPIFNIADSAVVIGAIICIWQSFRENP